MLSIDFHSVVARLSHFSSFKTAVRGSLTTSSRSNKRNVDDHLVGQLDSSFLPHLKMNISVALVDLLILLTRTYALLSDSLYVVSSLNFWTISCIVCAKQIIRLAKCLNVISWSTSLQSKSCSKSSKTVSSSSSSSLSSLESRD